MRAVGRTGVHGLPVPKLAEVEQDTGAALAMISLVQEWSTTQNIPLMFQIVK